MSHNKGIVENKIWKKTKEDSKTDTRWKIWIVSTKRKNIKKKNVRKMPECENQSKGNSSGNLLEEEYN